MKELVTELFSNFGQKLVMFLLVGTTAVTTGTAVSKVVSKQPKVEQETVNLSEDGASSEDDSIAVTTPTPTSKSTVTPSLAVPKATATPTVAAVVDNTKRCIITLFGKTYDVYSLKTSHSGGDIFQCGTDMTNSYQGKHGTSVSRMARYAYDPSSPTTITPASTNGVDDDEDEEREDKRHEDRYEDEDESEDGEDDDDD